MRSTLRRLSDRFLGRGEAAITVPVMDGALKPNRALDEAEVVTELPGLDDLASDGEQLWLSAGPALYRLGADGAPRSSCALPCRHRPGPAGPERLAVALGGRELRVLRRQGGEWRIEAQLLELAGTPLVGLNALNFDTQGRLLFSEGSQLRPRGLGPRPDDAGPQRPRGPLDTGRRQRRLLAQGLHHAFGVLALGERCWPARAGATA
jgi:hypothetical protein